MSETKPNPVIDPDEVEAMKNAAFSGDYMSALKKCDRLYQTPETDYVASFISGYCRFHLNDPQAAVEHFQAALQLHPQDPTSWYYLVVSKYRAGQKIGALVDAVHAMQTWAGPVDGAEFRAILQTGLSANEDLHSDPAAASARAEFAMHIEQLVDLPLDLQMEIAMALGAIDKARAIAKESNNDSPYRTHVAKIMDVHAFVGTGQGRFLYEALEEAIPFKEISTKNARASNTKTIHVPANSAYVAELSNVFVAGTSSAVFGSAGELVSDTYAHVDYGKYVDSRAAENIILTKGEHAVIRINKTVTSVKRAINLMGLASNHFGHWVSEYLPRLRHFMQLDDFSKLPLLINSDMPPSHVEFLRYICSNPLFEVGRNEVVQVQQLLVAPTITFYPFDLIAGHNVPPKHQASWSVSAMAFLREKVLSAIKPDRQIGRAIYLSRKNSAWGKPTNEAEFEQMLKAQSIQSVCLEDMNFKQQVETIHSADVIIAPTGSALNMAMFAQADARILVFSQKEPHNWGGWLGPMHQIGFDPQFLMMKDGSALGKHAAFTMDINVLNNALSVQ